MARPREIGALVPILEDPANAEKTSAELAEELIEALDDLRSTTHRLAVVARYAWRQGEEETVAVLGPFPTRARVAARTSGAEMAGTMQGGHGRFIVVPAYANARAAWDAVKPDKDAERMERFLARVHRDHPTLWNPWSALGPTCCCGVRAGGYCRVHKKANPAEPRGRPPCAAKPKPRRGPAPQRKVTDWQTADAIGRLRRSFPGLTVIDIIDNPGVKPDMSEAAAETSNVVQLPEPNWAESHPLEKRPQALDTDTPAGTARSNHLITISFTPKGAPMAVVRGDSAEEVKALLLALENEGVYTHIAAAQVAMLQQGPAAGILGPVAGAHPAPPVAQPPAVPPQQWAPQPAQAAPWGPPQPSPGQAPFGAMPAPQWGSQPVPGVAAPPPWAVAQLNIPFKQGDAWKAFREQVITPQVGGQIGGDVKWNAAGKVWWLSHRAAGMVAGQANGAFGQPMPLG